MGSSSGTTGDPTLFSYRWGRDDGNLPAAPGLPADGPSTYWGGTLRDWWEIGLRPGDEVIGASINGYGRLEIFVTKVGANATLGEIVRALQAAQASKAGVQRLADRVSSVFVPFVLALAATAPERSSRIRASTAALVPETGWLHSGPCPLVSYSWAA